MRVEIGELVLDLTDEQAASLRRQLGMSPCDSALIDAASLAKRLGVSREYVYDHAEELGGERIGNGSRPRWRFPVALASTELADKGGARPDPRAKPKAQGRRSRQPGNVRLLAVRGDEPYAASNEKRPPNGAVNAERGPYQRRR